MTTPELGSRIVDYLESSMTNSFGTLPTGDDWAQMMTGALASTLATAVRRLAEQAR